MKKFIEYLWRWLPFVLISLSVDYLKKNKNFFIKNSDGTTTAARPGLYVLYFRDSHSNNTFVIRPIASQIDNGENIELEFKGLGNNALGGWSEKLIKFSISKLWFKLIQFADPEIANADSFIHDLERRAVRIQGGELYPGLSTDHTQWNKAMTEALNHFSREGKLTKINEQAFMSSITENGEYVKVLPSNLFEYLQKYHSKSLLWRILGGGEPLKIQHSIDDKTNARTNTKTEEVILPPLADGW